MTQKTNSSFLDKLKVREDIDKHILKEYEDLLYHTFQVIYEVDAEVKWERILRFSSDSNFITISGSAVIPEGTIISGKTKLQKPMEIYPSFTFPWELLDTKASAYDIAEAAKDVKCFGAMVGGTRLIEYLRSSDFTYDNMKLSLPDYQNFDKINVVPDDDSDDLDLSELTAIQLRTLSFEEE